MYMYIYYVHAVPVEARDGMGYPGIRVTDSCEI